MGNILIQAWIYNDNKGTRLVFMDKSLMVGAKEEDWEETSVVASISDIKEWCEACQEIIEAEAIERAIKAEEALEIVCEYIYELTDDCCSECIKDYFLKLASEEKEQS